MANSRVRYQVITWEFQLAHGSKTPRMKTFYPFFNCLFIQFLLLANNQWIQLLSWNLTFLNIDVYSPHGIKGRIWIAVLLFIYISSVSQFQHGSYRRVPKWGTESTIEAPMLVCCHTNWTFKAFYLDTHLCGGGFYQIWIHLILIVYGIYLVKDWKSSGNDSLFMNSKY